MDYLENNIVKKIIKLLNNKIKKCIWSLLTNYINRRLYIILLNSGIDIDYCVRITHHMTEFYYKLFVNYKTYWYIIIYYTGENERGLKIYLWNIKKQHVINLL